MLNTIAAENLKFPITSYCEIPRKPQFQLYFDYISTYIHAHIYVSVYVLYMNITTFCG